MLRDASQVMVVCSVGLKDAQELLRRCGAFHAPWQQLVSEFVLQATTFMMPLATTLTITFNCPQQAKRKSSSREELCMLPAIQTEMVLLMF